MNTFALLVILMADPIGIHPRSLVIAYNPRESYGISLHAQLTTDLTEVAKRYQIEDLSEIIGFEFTRRRIHKYFRVKFIETSDDPWFEIGSSDPIRFPRPKGRDIRELPGYLTFLDWVVNQYYHDDFRQMIAAENHRLLIQGDIARTRSANEFIALKEKEGYVNQFGYLGDEIFFIPQLSKDGEFFFIEDLGWVEPKGPKLMPKIQLKPCPLDEKWVLP